jgi:hypothetical protein
MNTFIICICIAMLCCTMAVSGHETFVRPLSGWVEVGDVAILPVGSGHNTTSQELPFGYVSLNITSQSGSKESHVFTNKTTTDGFWKVYGFDIDEPGLYILDVYHTEGFWTHIMTNPPDKGFWENEYFKDINFGFLNKTGWADNWYVERSYPKYCYGKAFLAGTNSDFAVASKSIGQKFELVPLDNITTIGKGDFQFQVLYEGKPFENITVQAEKVGNDTMIKSVTDKDGKVNLYLNDSSELSEWVVWADSAMDIRIVEAKDLPRGTNTNAKSYVGPVYRAALVLRSDYIKPSTD